ncbi:CLUMA_CG005401, isoform A [Clunio marinus]|uniref:CLUMA_CG005401, isoform A n=1 Tax=Clunio marinus TaxID=568069 RepID=A0A1J1I059_9DIPT|nr:CLUMA_CG005401, isoform A [Clunio marinus]
MGSLTAATPHVRHYNSPPSVTDATSVNILQCKNIIAKVSEASAQIFNHPRKVSECKGVYMSTSFGSSFIGNSGLNLNMISIHYQRRSMFINNLFWEFSAEVSVNIYVAFVLSTIMRDSSASINISINCWKLRDM